MTINKNAPPIIFLIFALTSVILTYPLLFHLFTHIPLGSETAGTVPYFNLWTLQWNVEQLARGYPNYWNAPIFAPHQGTFAFSENQLVSGLLAAPLWLGLRSPAAAYNALVLLFLTLNGWFAYWLLRSWGLSHRPALLAGFFVQALPFTAQEMGVLQLIALFGFLWLLLFLHRFFDHNRRPSASSNWRTNLCLALGVPVAFFTCSYYGLFTILFLPLAGLAYLRPTHFRLKTLGQLLIIGLLMIALSGPFLWGQQRHLARYDFSRSDKIIENNSARLSDYGKFLDDNLFYGHILAIEPAPGQRLFPGLGLILLAGVGLMGASRLRTKAYLLGAIILALILSLGLRFDLDGWRPYGWVRVYTPGFAQLRSPFRFTAFVHLHLALLAGFGLSNMGRRLPALRVSLFSLLATFVLIESVALPLPLQSVPPLQPTPAWQSWLNRRDQPVRVVFLPFAPTSRAADFEQTTLWMLAGYYFQGDMVNGYSGFFPRDHGRLRREMLQFPTADGLFLLEEKDVDYVVVFYGLPQAPPAEAVKAYLPLVYQDRSAQVAIYALDAPR